MQLPGIKFSKYFAFIVRYLSVGYSLRHPLSLFILICVFCDSNVYDTFIQAPEGFGREHNKLKNTLYAAYGICYN